MTDVMTVTGPIPADELGFTLPHEHIFLDLMRDTWGGNYMLNDPELAYQELMRYKNAGGVTLVDQTSGGLTENDQEILPVKHPLAIREMSERTGLNIVLGCGWYRETYYEKYLWRAKTNQIAEEIERDVTEGIEGTDVRAGLIGEIGAHFNWISPVEERVLRAAGRAQKRTGVALTTHATRGPLGLDQLDILEEEGVDLRRVAVGHCFSHPDIDYQKEIARRGAFLSFDNMQPTSERGHTELIALVDEVLKCGLIDHLLFSHDVCYRSMYHAYGGDGYDYCSTRLLGDLAGIGVTEEQFHQIMVDNPRRLLTGDD
jgi:phosphotriesterase-related protein